MTPASAAARRPSWPARPILRRSRQQPRGRRAGGYLLKVESSWRIAPTTAAFVVATELTHHSIAGAVEAGLKRTAEVILGCLIGLLVSWAFARLWPMRERSQPAAPAPP